MKTKLKWRLSKLPTPSELVELVNNKLVTQEEAKEILFTQETEEEENVDGLKAEIKFLRQLVDKLSDKQTIINTVHETIPSYKNWDWYRPYEVWCANGTVTSGVDNANFSDLNALN